MAAVSVAVPAADWEAATSAAVPAGVPSEAAPEATPQVASAEVPAAPAPAPSVEAPAVVPQAASVGEVHAAWAHPAEVVVAAPAVAEVSPLADTVK